MKLEIQRKQSNRPANPERTLQKIQKAFRFYDSFLSAIAARDYTQYPRHNPALQPTPGKRIRETVRKTQVPEKFANHIKPALLKEQQKAREAICNQVGQVYEAAEKGHVTMEDAINAHQDMLVIFDSTQTPNHLSEDIQVFEKAFSHSNGKAHMLYSEEGITVYSENEAQEAKEQVKPEEEKPYLPSQIRDILKAKLLWDNIERLAKHVGNTSKTIDEEIVPKDIFQLIGAFVSIDKTQYARGLKEELGEQFLATSQQALIDRLDKGLEKRGAPEETRIRIRDHFVVTLHKKQKLPKNTPIKDTPPKEAPTKQPPATENSNNNTLHGIITAYKLSPSEAILFKALWPTLNGTKLSRTQTVSAAYPNIPLENAMNTTAVHLVGLRKKLEGSGMSIISERRGNNSIWGLVLEPKDQNKQPAKNPKQPRSSPDPVKKQKEYDLSKQPQALHELAKIEKQMKESGYQTIVVIRKAENPIVNPSPFQRNLRLNENQKKVLYYLNQSSVYKPITRSNLQEILSSATDEKYNDEDLDFLFNQLNEVLAREQTMIADLSDIFYPPGEPKYCILPDTPEVKDLLSKKEMPVPA